MDVSLHRRYAGQAEIAALQAQAAALKVSAAESVAKEREATQRKLEAANAETVEAWTRVEDLEATLVSVASAT
jgi:hypothetical protein